MGSGWSQHGALGTRAPTGVSLLSGANLRAPFQLFLHVSACSAATHHSTVCVCVCVFTFKHAFPLGFVHPLQLPWRILDENYWDIQSTQAGSGPVPLRT